MIELYHGTADFFDEIGLEKAGSNSDFGKGFYLTTNYEQAKKWALLKTNNGTAYVMKFLFDETNLTIKKYDTIDINWVMDIYSAKTKHQPIKGIDFIVSPLAMDGMLTPLKRMYKYELENDTEKYNLYKNKIISRLDKVIDANLKINGQQYVLLTVNAIQHLHFVKREVIKNE